MTRVNLGPANHHAAICLSGLRFLSPNMKALLRRQGIWEDLMQELRLAGWKAWKMDMDDRQTRNLTARSMYAFFKAYGFYRYRGGYVRPDRSFSAVFKFDVGDSGIPNKGEPIMPFLPKDGDHLDEKMLALLKEHPEGLTRRQIAMRLQIPVLEVKCYLAPLIRKRLVLEISRENTLGRPLSPLLVATETGYPMPEPRKVAQERDERIRHAYLVEKKSIKRIQRELHHDKRTIRRALEAAAVT